jgi:hypothetical protein
MRSLAVLMMLTLPVPLAGQSTFTLKPPVDQLQWMIGDWEGPASYQRGPETFGVRQTERVEIQSGGMAIAVRGRGFYKNPDGSEEVRYEAFAVLFRNRDGSLGFRAFNMEGQYIDPTIVMQPDGLVWSFDDHRIGKVRYTIKHTPADEWHEIGEWSRDGASWTQFMEMRLNRKPAGSVHGT